MTIAEAKRFYKQNENLYKISKNKSFLNWLRDAIENGYHCYIAIDDLQELIDNIVSWYEIKYPNREFEAENGVIHTDFSNITNIAEHMDIKQLMYRLPHTQLCLMECEYRSHGGGQRAIYEDGKEVGWERTIFMKIDYTDIDDEIWYDDPDYFLLHADPRTGMVSNSSDLEDYTDKKDLHLDQVYALLSSRYSDELDFSELRECLIDHKYDTTLRFKILQMVALKLLYSEKTVPEYGYERAKKFIEEFNSELNMGLVTDEIDEIMGRDYKTDTVDNTVKDKAVGLVKSLLGK